MQPVTRQRTYLILILLVILSVGILTVYLKEGSRGPLHRVQEMTMTVLAPIEKGTLRLVKPLQTGWDFFLHAGELKGENAELKGKVARLEQQEAELAKLKAENERLRKLAGFKEELASKTVAARVIGKPASNWQTAVILDRGRRAGIKTGMPVVTSDGLVGQVILASSNSARVLLVTDPKSGVAVQIERTGDDGILKGRLDGSLSIKYISRDSKVQIGDGIVTSGLGGIFPKGINVGKVAAVSQPPFGLYKNIDVNSAVDFQRLEEVLVVLNPLASARGEMMNQERDASRD